MQTDIGRGHESASVSCEAPPCIEEIISGKNWKAKWTLEKRWGDWTDEDILSGRAPDPYETVVIDGNGLLNDGINFLLNRLIGGADGTYPAWNNANAHIKVGNGTAAFAATQTDLQGGSTAEKPMDATYPQVSAQTATWRSTFGSSDANFTWEEVGVKNGSGAISSTVKLLNRKVQSFGTKVSGATWTMTLQITIS